MTSIGIVGAGAVGGTIAARLANAGCDVTVYARGGRHDRLCRDGLILDCADEHIVTRPRVTLPEAAEPHDILFLCVKAHALESILPLCRRAMTAATHVVPLMNGVPFWYFADRPSPRPVAAVDPDGALLAAFPAERLVGGVVFLRAEVRENGSIVSQGNERLVLGPVTPATGSGAAGSVVAEIADLLNASGVATRISPEIRRDLWPKIALNLATNPLSVATGATLDQMFDHPALLAIVRPILAEVLALADVLGVEPALDLEAMIEMGRKAGPFMTSMAQDHRMGRPLELDAIGESVLELAASVDLALPAATAVYSIVKWTEQRRLASR